MKWIYFNEFSFDCDRDSYFYISVLKATKVFQLHELGSECVQILLKYITSENILDITESAYQISDINLTTSCISFIANQPHNERNRIILLAATSATTAGNVICIYIMSYDLQSPLTKIML
jgi:hypothetical protein